MTATAVVDFSRWALAGFFLAVAAFYSFRLLIARWRLGARLATHGKAGSLHWGLSLAFRVFRLLILGLMVARVPWPALDSLLLPFAGLQSSTITIAGLLLLCASFGFILYCHNFMGAAWRSGIPETRLPALITTGPFAWSRNPIFLAIQAAQVGFFLALPSLFTLVCLIVGVAVIQLQVRLEERRLSAAFGQDYLDYCERTARWLPLPPALVRGSAARPCA